MEPKQYYIGIDVGGTSVKEGLFDEDGNLLAKASVPTPPIVDAAGFAAVTEAIDQAMPRSRPTLPLTCPSSRSPSRSTALMRSLSMRTMPTPLPWARPGSVLPRACRTW